MNCECCMGCYKIDACDGRCNFKCNECSYNKNTIKPNGLSTISERINKSIKLYYGKNAMSFDENGDIKINDRLLTNDEEIVNALRMLLNLK